MEYISLIKRFYVAVIFYVRPNGFVRPYYSCHFTYTWDFVRVNYYRKTNEKKETKPTASKIV